MMKHSSNIHFVLGGNTRSKYRFVFDNHPVLTRLIPVGLNVRERYKTALTSCFTGKESEEILRVFRELWVLAEKGSGVVNIYSVRPQPKVVLETFKDFVQEFMGHYFNNFVKPTLNAEGINDAFNFKE